MYIRHTADNKLFVASVVFRALYLAWTTQTFPRDASTISSRARAAAGEGKEEKKNWQHTHTHTHRAVGGGRKKWGAHAFPSQCTFTCWYVSVSSLHCGNVFMRIYTRLVRARAWCVWFDCLKKKTKKKQVHWRKFEFVDIVAAMPEKVSISDFVSLANEDITSPSTSCFQAKMSDCRSTVTGLEEVSEWVSARVSGSSSRRVRVTCGTWSASGP